MHSLSFSDRIINLSMDFRAFSAYPVFRKDLTTAIAMDTKYVRTICTQV